uniref:Receptor protein-tyrosine kinase n=1 Tax=Loa loa TaxID=7209 RepID=A0A1I7W2I5_LOALO
MHEFPAEHVPEKCICLWYLTGEYRKNGINWTEINDERCDAFKKYASKIRKPLGKKICENGACGSELSGVDTHEVLQGVGLHEAMPSDIMHDQQQQPNGLQAAALLSDPVKLLDWLVANNWVDVSHLLSNLLTRQKITAIKPALSDWNTLDTAEKRLRARTLLQQEIPEISTSITTNGIQDVDSESKDVDILMNSNDSSSSETDEKIPEKLDFLMHDQPRLDESDEAHVPDIAPRIHAPVITMTTSATGTTKIAFLHAANSLTARTTTRRIFPLQKVPPYFKVRDEDADTSVITPSGRTIKLQCKAGGQPEPQVIWFNNNKKVITTEVRRPVGTEFRLRKNTLEIEDVAESDSGDYTCEAFNSAGSVTRTFKLRVVDRMRSKPIIVPNILLNQTVDANSTVNFTCKVISDLTPHIVWIRIEMTNNSIYYWNETDRKYVFRYTDMQSVENAIVTKTSQDSSTLTIVNVTVADQGMYACVSGNHLGHAIANATLTVNEFHAMTLATGNPDTKWSRPSAVAVVFLLILLIFIVAITLFYILCIRKRSKAQIAEMEQFIGPVKKRVIVTKRPVDPENDGWSDMPSTYQIHVEPIATSGTRRPRLSSDLTFLSDYEIPPDPAWEIERSRLHFVEMLGEGAFGEVWKAILRVPIMRTTTNQGDIREEEVAVKKLKASAHEKELIDLVSEMETFKIIGHHENLLRLIGCCTGTGPLYVIVELCKHGNLRDFLRAHRPRDADSGSQVPEATNFGAGVGGSSDHYLEPRKLQRKLTVVSTHDEPMLIKHLTQRHLVQFAWQVAKGMEFMASRKIIHRDLAARNVLVADGFVMKISDFGLSRDVHYNDYYRKKGNGRLPIKWMALEALDSHVYTIYSDVWSFGILLWEIMTLGGTPYPSIAMQQLYSCLKEGYRMEAPDNCPEEVYDVMVACWQEKPENRPSFDTLVDYFDWMLTQSARDHEKYLEVQSIASDGSEEVRNIAPPPPPPLRITESPSRHRKARPLSEPVISPSEPVVDPDSDSEFDNDSHPLLSGEKAVLYEKQSRSGVYHAFIRRCPAIPVANTSPFNELNLNSTATVSIDSAIGSPLWSTGATSALLDSDANEKGDSPMSYKKRRLSNGPCSYSDAGKKNEIIGEEDGTKDFICNSGLLNQQYVNVDGGQAASTENGKLRSTKFPFPPLRHTRFSDSTAYEADSIHMDSIGKPALEGSASAFTVNEASTLLTEVSKENPNETSVSKSNSSNQQRRFSIESSSSGRGGSSGMSSAEGLGGVVEFCQIGYSGGKTTLYELYSQQQQQPERKIPFPILEVDK